VAFSPDSELLASAESDGAVQVSEVSLHSSLGHANSLKSSTPQRARIPATIRSISQNKTLCERVHSTPSAVATDAESAIWLYVARLKPYAAIAAAT
jgi:hypothetical protein